MSLDAHLFTEVRSPPLSSQHQANVITLAYGSEEERVKNFGAFYELAKPNCIAFVDVCGEEEEMEEGCCVGLYWWWKRGWHCVPRHHSLPTVQPCF